MKLSDLPSYAIGNTIQLVGAIYEGEGHLILAVVPGEDIERYNSETGYVSAEILAMTTLEWDEFIRQTDLQEVEVTNGIEKAIVRKTQRLIEQSVSWNVFRRDGYACRYCGRNDVPLTVDHLITWEVGGPSVEANLVSSCRKCNKTRGNKTYENWLASPEYRQVSSKLVPSQLMANIQLLPTLGNIRLEDRLARKTR